MRAYLETSALVVYCFGRKLEPEKYKSVKALFDKINSHEITGVEIIPLLKREQRIQYYSHIKLNDASDIPHAILAIIEKCNCIVTYDAHFDDINTIIKINHPEELL